MVFASGLLSGGALVALWFAFTFAQPPAAAPAEAISKVAGWDGTHVVAAAQIARPVAGESLAAPAPKPPAPVQRRPARAAAAAESAPAVDAERRSTSQIVREALGSTVFVRGGRVYGAGVLLDARGHVLTCQHVIAGLDQIVVSFSDGASFDATVVESDPKLDLALLRIATDRVPAVEPAAVTSVKLGDDVFAFGAPRKMAFSLSRGMVSYVGRAFDGVYYLQTDLAMNGGSSGGPVLNDRGQVVALSSFVLRDSEGLAFALPIEYAYRRFAAHLQAPKALEGSLGDAFEGWLSSLGEEEAPAAGSPR
jgi:S1-C subfamily serine protease